LGPRSYDIEIGAGQLARAGQFLAARAEVSHAVVITDANVVRPYAEQVQDVLASAKTRVDLAVIEPGEPSKSVAAAASLWERLLHAGADRKSVVVAVGGGVVGDLAGFVAATYARGLPFFQVPTTLLAQVDSSVGGKVGIDLPEAKNMVGAFLQPLGVLIDPATLTTLDDREYRAGLGEVVKYGVILDAEFFAFLENSADAVLRRDPEVLQTVIARCCRLKADVVQRDEFERTGLRAVLNYGHTFGHAFEALSGYGRLLHGEAVALGMLCACRLAGRLGRVDRTTVDRQARLLAALGLATALPALDPGQVLRTMMHDKKVQHGRLHLVLPSRLGHVELVGGIEPADVLAALEGLAP
jgi:3-dehydroquinate synthase